ncbi:hypothetical protein TpMuguga_03g00633 [Theileria parva strain Muguga]|uniref:Uncharacterized protein n=1 Tax=Theileria parva TaxID=5875 RepID=Q4MZ58_THEPA|nr:uncharacterized protein TpMuguga_03g00633 [Theileria parva strain Muguga]EAN30474.1 hypothetical protein TpMuguga_03g00633 [Theileria parva strain Muguga]|eukprot:XP_762757.1 hypothetical protein [Theileria parva strain Muguga]
MLEMKVLLIVSLFFTLGSCIELRLPLLNEDSKFFTVNKVYVQDFDEQDNESQCYGVTFYEAKDEDVIREVYYHGVLIFSNFSEFDESYYSYLNYGYPSDRSDDSSSDGEFEDGISQLVGTSQNNQSYQNDTQTNIKKESIDETNIKKESIDGNQLHESSGENNKESTSGVKFRRVVTNMELKTQVILCIYILIWQADEYYEKVEKIFAITDDLIRAIGDQELYVSLQYENAEDTIRIIRNIMKRKPIRLMSYEDLDQVDDVPYLVKGRNISPRQIRKEVDQILNNPNISEQDLMDAGPSGLSEFRLYYPNAESDSD